MIKKAAAAFAAFAMLTNTAFASILGSEAVSQKSYGISDGTVLHENKFMSDQKGVGLQSEYYAEYIPNTATVPVVVTGEAVFGKRTAAEAAAYMQENGMRPMLGINASYFSLKTGVPMGHVISGGRVVSKDTTTLQGIGFLEDGSAFIAPLSIGVTVSTIHGDVGVDNVNKHNGAALACISMFTPDFGVQTENEAEVLSLVLDVPQDLTIGSEFEAKVKAKSVHTGGIPIGDNEIVLTVNTVGSYEYHYNLMNALNEGDTITISCSAGGDERWGKAVEGLASVGETLISGGTVYTEFTKGAAPRTAVGITAEGKVIFYVIDGRQSGHSYGVQLKTLAARMAELGCVDAINLDGGGSSSVSGVYPGADSIEVLNSPSDGALRKVTNFIFLKNNNERTNLLGSIYTMPQQEKYLTGTTVALESTGIDTAYYKTDAGAVEYSVEGESIVDANSLTLIGNGTVRLTSKSGEVETVSENYVYDNPDSITLIANGNEVKSLTLADGAAVSLAAEAYVGSNKLISDKSCFSFSVGEEFGSIENDVFTARSNRTVSGVLTVTAGKKSVEIPVTVVNDNYVFSDTTEHWARDMIRYMAERGAVNGYETDGGKIFMPDNSITRGEFAVMLAGYLSLDTTAYENDEKVFDDEIPAWALGSINAMYSLGFVSGKQSDNGLFFAPADKITRAEAAAIIGRTLPFLTDEADVGFTDAAKIPDWASTFVARLVSAGIISGYEDNTLRPQNAVTRAEAVTMLYKVSGIK